MSLSRKQIRYIRQYHKIIVAMQINKQEHVYGKEMYDYLYDE